MKIYIYIHKSDSYGPRNIWYSAATHLEHPLCLHADSSERAAAFPHILLSIYHKFTMHTDAFCDISKNPRYAPPLCPHLHLGRVVQAAPPHVWCGLPGGNVADRSICRALWEPVRIHHHPWPLSMFASEVWNYFVWSAPTCYLVCSVPLFLGSFSVSPKRKA